LALLLLLLIHHVTNVGCRRHAVAPNVLQTNVTIQVGPLTASGASNGTDKKRLV
jgi:hypothetical protein